jgi:hypothetical protein
MVVKRQQETFAPVTLGHIRSHGCRDLLVYCISGRCHHSATLNGNRLGVWTSRHGFRPVWVRLGQDCPHLAPPSRSFCRQRAVH